MLWVDEELKKSIEQAARAFRKKLEQKPSVQQIRSLISEHELGIFRQCRKLQGNELLEISQKGPVAGVDGSTNTAGGPHPYCITLQRALAKGCGPRGHEISRAQALSPLLWDEPVSEEDYRRQVKENLALLEAQVALKYIEEFSPSALLIDGSLVRLKIEAQGVWEDLRELALSRGTVPVGVVEGISTSVIADALRGKLPPNFFLGEDWELLTGILKVGEVLEVRPGLFKEGFRTFFARFSPDPKPIGIDLLEEQQTELSTLQDLLYTMTPNKGRGIPLWLDIVDEKVKITDNMVEGLMKTYLGEAHFEFILEKRRRRDW